MTTPVIDTHSHIVPPDMWKAMLADGRRYGVEITGDEKRHIVRLEGSSHTRPMYMPLTHDAERIATMDVQGVDMQVLAGYVDFSGYTMPLDLGIKFSELQNEAIAGVVAGNPERYAGAANVPLQDPERAATEARLRLLPPPGHHSRRRRSRRRRSRPRRSRGRRGRRHPHPRPRPNSPT